MTPKCKPCKHFKRQGANGVLVLYRLVVVDLTVWRGVVISDRWWVEFDHNMHLRTMVELLKNFGCSVTKKCDAVTQSIFFFFFENRIRTFPIEYVHFLPFFAWGGQKRGTPWRSEVREITLIIVVIDVGWWEDQQTRRPDHHLSAAADLSRHHHHSPEERRSSSSTAQHLY